MKRRNFIAILGSTTALTGCGLASNIITPIITPVIKDITISASVLNDAALIAKGLATALGVLTGLGIFTTIATDINNIQNAVALLTATMNESDAQNDVSNIETAINDIIDVAASLPLPPPFGIALQAASVLIPILEGAVGLVISTTSSAARMRSVLMMTPDDARAALTQIIGS